jgi:hypothetical protein
LSLNITISKPLWEESNKQISISRNMVPTAWAFFLKEIKKVLDFAFAWKRWRIKWDDYFPEGHVVIQRFQLKGKWQVGWIIIESISWKKAKSQITVTEDIFPENKCFVSKGNHGQSLLYCATCHIDSLLALSTILNT